MDNEEKAKFLLEVLTAAMLITLHKQGFDDDAEPGPGLGIVGGPPDKSDEDKRPKGDEQGFGTVFALNKMTDLVMRSLQAAARYRMADELNMLFWEEGEEHDDMSMIQVNSIGVTFNMRFKKNLDGDKLKMIELAADTMRPYAHYRLFEKEPTVSEFLEQIEWRDAIEHDPDISQEEKGEALAFFDNAMPEVVSVLHLHHDSIREHAGRIFDKSLAHLRSILAGDVKRSNTRLDVLFGIKPLNLGDILKFVNPDK